MTYAELDTLLRGRCKFRRKLGNNTYARRVWDYAIDPEPIVITIRFHATDILTFFPNGDISMYVGRWYTNTTKERLNRFLPDGYGVYSAKGEWWLWSRECHGPYALFQNGMVLHADGFVDNTLYYAEWEHQRQEQIRANRQEAFAKRSRCWLWIGNRYCDLLLRSDGTCARHGKPCLPGHDKED